MFSSFDDIGRMDERAKFRTPGADRVRSGRDLMLQDEPISDSLVIHIQLDLARIATKVLRRATQRAGDEVI